MDLPARVLRYINQADLLPPSAKLLLGVSGGPDSLCLLDLLGALRETLTPHLYVAHLDHGLRPESPAESDFVRAEAEKRGLPFFTETADTRAHALAHKQSLEEAARELRYAFLARVAHTVGAAHIAVAHTADDQAETVLMHFLRGAGVAGLRGILPKTEIGSWMSEVRSQNLQPLTSDLSILNSPLYLLRPLLTTTRAEIEAYCAERGLAPVHDPTNTDLAYFRNRLRHELLPQLETYNPNIRALLQRTATVMAGEHKLLRAHADQLWRTHAHPTHDRVTFDKSAWRALTLPEQRALARAAVHHLCADLRDMDFTPLDQALRFSHTAQAGRACDLFAGLRLSITLTAIVIDTWATTSTLPADIPLLTAEGELTPGWTFLADTLPLPQRALPLGERAGVRGFTLHAEIDADTLPLGESLGASGLSLRPRRPGDRFQPLGLDGHALKLSDFFINAKIEKAWRDRWPLVVCGEAIIWVAGLRLNERYKVTAATKNVWRLEFVKDTP